MRIEGGGIKMVNEDVNQDGDFFKRMSEKINQIPKSEIEKSERIENTIREIKDWLNEGGFTYFDAISILEILKNDFLKEYENNKIITDIFFREKENEFN